MSEALIFDLRYANARFPGIGSYAAGLAEAMILLRPKWPWKFLMPAEARFDLSFVPAGMRVAPLANEKAPTPLMGQWELGRILHALGASLYHSPYLLRPWKAPCKSIVTLHDVIPLEHGSSMNLARRTAYRWVAVDALQADCVVTDSAASRESIRRAFPGSREPIVVHPGCRIERGGDAWPAWPKPTVLTVGINKPHKNLETLIRALAMVPAAQRPLLLCAGPEDARYPGAAALASKHGIAGDVRALGMVNERQLAGLYRSATLFAFPTRIEGFGLPLLEAMTLGVPALVSDLPVLREIAGETAWFVAADDAAAWSRALTSLLGDAPHRTELARQASDRAGRFTYEVAARALFLHYEAFVPELRAAGAGAASGAGATSAALAQSPSGAGAPDAGNSA
jgi:glycosyltransferase involved in cell wall biosynthesis